jgi:N-acetylneuraminic acid mutarotase
MKYFNTLLFLSFMLISTAGSAQVIKKTAQFTWGELPTIPDHFGFAGSFSGISGNALIVAGGANFPDGGAPWTGSKKVWSDKIFVLDKAMGKWKVAGKLPQPLGYGVSITWGNQLICIGGSNEKGHSANVYSILYDGKNISVDKLPDLPQAIANATGAVMGNIVYLAGGLFTPDASETAHIFWSFDLSSKGNKRIWHKLETWPGPSRMLAVAGVADQTFYLFSGTDLIKNKKGGLERQYLTDAFSYSPSAGWKKIASLPKAVVAAPYPAYSLDHQSLLIFGGDDGELAPKASSLKEKHPGFSDQILAYDVRKNKWSVEGNMLKEIKPDAQLNPNNSIWPAVTNTMVIWQGNLVFPGGEVRPAVRTPKVIIARPINNN